MSEKRAYKRYGVEFKEDAVKMSLVGNKSVAQVASELGISYKNLCNWRRDYKLKQNNPGATEDKKRIKQLEKENKELQLERDILKKATAIFSQG